MTLSVATRGFLVGSASLVVTRGFGTGARPVPVTDMHDGIEEYDHKKRDEEYRQFREARERLREQIITAMAGPEREEVAKVVLPYIEPSPVQKEALDFERIDYERMWANQAAMDRLTVALRTAYAAGEREIDDEEAWMMLL
jgi:hypothetical protein